MPTRLAIKSKSETIGLMVDPNVGPTTRTIHLGEGTANAQWAITVPREAFPFLRAGEIAYVSLTLTTVGIEEEAEPGSMLIDPSGAPLAANKQLILPPKKVN